MDKKKCGYRPTYFLHGESRECDREIYRGSKYCIFHTEAEKKNRGEFQKAFLTYIAEIEEAYSEKPDSGIILDCRGFEFPDETYMDFLTISPPADFSGARFAGRFNFLIINFTGDVWFENAKFEDIITFQSVVFRNDANFVMAEFFKPHFINIEVVKTLSFHRARFLSSTNFRSIVKKPFVDKSGEPIKDDDNWSLIIKEPRANVVFTDVSISPEAVVNFRDLDLSGWSFAGTFGLDNPVQVRFNNVTWDAHGLFTRKTTGDDDAVNSIKIDENKLENLIKLAAGFEEEFYDYESSLEQSTIRSIARLLGNVETNFFQRALLENADYLKNNIKTISKLAIGEGSEAAAEVYRALRRNYEIRLAYEAASDFHIGQMEMLLKNPTTSRPKKFFLRWYRRVSNFGESVVRPLWWFAGIWAAFFVIWLVLPARHEFAGVLNVIKMNFDWPWEWLSKTRFPDITEFGWFIWRKFWFTATNFVTFPKPEGSYFVRFLGGLQRFLGVAVVTFFILALRRAFRR
jgi:hypothetical protein